LQRTAGPYIRVTTATAIDQSLITRITKAAMIATLHDEPEFSELFMADLLSRTVELKRTQSINYSIQAEKRLARTLLLLVSEQSGLSYARAKDFRLWPIATNFTLGPDVSFRAKAGGPFTYGAQLRGGL
jgi:CRP-like cAMP-binding protein